MCSLRDWKTQISALRKRREYKEFASPHGQAIQGVTGQGPTGSVVTTQQSPVLLLLISVAVHVLRGSEALLSWISWYVSG